MSSVLAGFRPRGSDFDLAGFRADALAGVTVAVVALPLALGFGVTSGAGAAAGLYTAIIAGFLAAVFGGSNYQVSGPTGAMTVVLLPIVARHGPAALSAVGLLAGVLLVALAFARIGRFVNYIPYPVITGFTIGIALIIFLQQVPGLLGVAKPEGEQVVLVTLRAVATFVTHPTWGAPVLGLLTVAVMLVWDRLGRFRGFPASMAALAVVTGVSLLPMFAEVARVGGIPAGLPPLHAPGMGGLAVTDLVRAGVAIAILAALESLLSAVVADGMTIGERHDPDRELFGQGLANIGSALAGGIPATAALARTAVNVRSGARTRLAAIIHALAIGVIVMSLASLVEQIPLSVLAGILMVVAVHMVEGEAFRQTLRSTKSDAATMVLTLVVTIAFDLILAIEVGMIAAGALFIARMSRMLHIDLASLTGDGDPVHEDADAASAERAVRAEDLVVFRIDGPIFFGAADRFFDELLRIDHHIKAVVLRMRRVPVMDMTGAAALHSLVERLARRHVLVLLSGVQDQPRTLLERTGILEAVTRDGYHLFDTTDQAIAHARQHLCANDHVAPATDHPHPPAAGDIQRDAILSGTRTDTDRTESWAP